MKVERAGSVCSDDAPSSPESVVSSDSSPVASPQPSPQPLSENFNDQRMYSPAYTPEDASSSPSAPSPAFSYPPSPLYSNSYSGFEFSPNYDPFENPLEPPPSCCGETRFECQAKFLRAVQEGNHREVKRILTRSSGSVQINGFTCDGQTALTQSCLNGNLEVIKLLVSHGASVHLTNRDGFSPLHIACWCGKLDVMQYLLRTVSGRK